ncbi:restriction endonuclease subunit S [Henriciella sp.]|uniref:restriction endonuclease subunit S n=1 Tax=Henriciella sp. TaxID=1968823 RepID=UPI00261CEBBD|nr:restriction endonuclease subunit S [Henriciella sp.]
MIKLYKFPRIAIARLVEKVSRPVSVEPETLYRQIGVRSHGRGLFDKEAVTGTSLGNKRVFWIEPDCFIVNIVFAWEQAIGRTTEADVGKIASHRFPMYRPLPEKADLNYLVYFFNTSFGKHLLGLASPGGAGRNKTLGQSEFLELEIPVPPIEEQRRIAEILGTWDHAIETTEKLIAASEAQKKALMQQLLTGQKRLPGFDGDWREVRLGELGEITYGTSPKGIAVEGGYYPIIGTGGEVGRTNQFTCKQDSVVIGRKGSIDKPQFVRGPFWAIDTTFFVLPSEHADIVWLFHALNSMSLARFSEASGVPSLSRTTLQSILIKTPDIREQSAIAQVLDCAAHETDFLRAKLETLRTEKAALMQQLLTGKRRVNTKEMAA